MRDFLYPHFYKKRNYGIFPVLIFRRLQPSGFFRTEILAKNGVREESKHRFSKILAFGIFPITVFNKFWLSGFSQLQFLINFGFREDFLYPETFRTLQASSSESQAPCQFPCRLCSAPEPDGACFFRRLMSKVRSQEDFSQAGPRFLSQRHRRQS